MSTLGVCRVELGWTQIANDYRAVTRAHGNPIVQGCLRCNAAHWPPRLRCACGSADLHWLSAGRRGRLISTVGVNLTSDQASSHWVPRKLAQRLPYTTVIVELDQWAGVRMAVLGDGLAFTEAPSGSAVTLSAECAEDSVTLVAEAAVA